VCVMPAAFRHPSYRRLVALTRFAHRASRTITFKPSPMPYPLMPTQMLDLNLSLSLSLSPSLSIYFAHGGVSEQSRKQRLNTIHDRVRLIN